jgi:phytoene synthase
VSWSPARWRELEDGVRRAAGAASGDALWRLIVRTSRRVLRTYSSSFFLVTRFLPPRQRAAVEVIYSAVRYPDEIVDTFSLPAGEKIALLDAWEQSYLRGMRQPDLKARLEARIPWILCGFIEVVRRYEIPVEHYRAFLGAMRRDVRPSPFPSLRALIDEYVYGSAIVVGYFLTHVYRAAPGRSLEEALGCARELGIALQLTNFVRDVHEDRLRGRLYLPLDMLAAEGLSAGDWFVAERAVALRRAICRLACHAEEGYAYARRHLDAFSADCRPAIAACIDVYQALNRRILSEPAPIARRLSVSPIEKFRVLPPDKYWRVPLAYAGLL